MIVSQVADTRLDGVHVIATNVGRLADLLAGWLVGESANSRGDGEEERVHNIHEVAEEGP